MGNLSNESDSLHLSPVTMVSVATFVTVFATVVAAGLFL